MKSIRIWTRYMAIIATGLAVLARAAVVTPADWKFGSDPGRDNLSDFTLTGDPTLWELQPTAGRIVHWDHFGDARQATVEVTDLGGASNKNFVVKAEVKVDVNSNRDWVRFGVLALASGATSYTTGLGAVLTLNDTNGFVLQLRNGFQGTTIGSGTWNGLTRNQLEGATLSFQMTGTYSGSDLLVDVSVTDDVTNVTSTIATQTLSAASYAGQWFGFGGRLSRNVSDPVIPMVLDYGSFEVIPEPASVGLLAGGLALVLHRRRFRIRR